MIRVSAEPEATLSDAMAAVQAQLSGISVPNDFALGFGSEAEEQARAFKQLQMMLILAIVLVYAVMASQYESLRDPFIIMFSVPTAIVGVVLALTSPLPLGTSQTTSTPPTGLPNRSVPATRRR